MMNKINCFISYSTPGVWDETLLELNASSLVNRVYLFGREQPGAVAEGVDLLRPMAGSVPIPSGRSLITPMAQVMPW